MSMLRTVAALVLALAPPWAFGTTPSSAAESLRARASTHAREAGAGAQTSQKTIKDPGEYNAYITALNTSDPVAKAAAMEAFVKQYPASIVKIDALEQAMAAYQQAGNAAKVQSIAAQILELEPANVRALAIAAFLERSKANDPSALKAVSEHCAKGLQVLPNWQKPEGASDGEYKKLREQMSQILNGACGFVALNRKDYPAARGFYLQSLAVDPNDLGNNYQLAVAELEMSPMDLNGVWYAAKAFNLAQGNAPAQKAISDYGKAKYNRYHGGEDGWDQIVAAAAAAAAGQSGPSADFAQGIKPKPTPAEIAVNAVKENDPATLSFSDYEFILSYRDASPANKEAAEKVWAAIQDKQNGGDTKLRLNGVKVIAATKDSIDAALTDENQQANKADLHVILEKPLLHPPAPGFMADVIGVLTGYTPDPFMFTMEKGELPAPPRPASPKRPAKRQQ